LKEKFSARELELNEITETYLEQEPSIRACALTGIDFTLPRFKEIACRNIELGFWTKKRD